MSRFETFRLAEIEETRVDSGRVGSLLEKLLASEIPGFILRGAGIMPVREMPLPLDIDNPSLVIGDCMKEVTWTTRGPAEDFGFHLDPRRAQTPARRKLVSFHTTKYGSSGLAMVPTVGPDTCDAWELIEDDPTQRGLAIHREYLLRYKYGMVDTELFEPVCYRNTLGPTDTAVFIECEVGHDFDTISDSRQYTCGFYPVGLAA